MTTLINLYSPITVCCMSNTIFVFGVSGTEPKSFKCSASILPSVSLHQPSPLLLKVIKYVYLHWDWRILLCLVPPAASLLFFHSASFTYIKILLIQPKGKFISSLFSLYSSRYRFKSIKIDLLFCFSCVVIPNVPAINFKSTGETYETSSLSFLSLQVSWKWERFV